MQTSVCWLIRPRVNSKACAGTIDRDARGTNDSVGETERGDDAIERHRANASVGTIDSVDANECVNANDHVDAAESMSMQTSA